ncbi:dihydropteroate synthase [Nonlabens sp. YIK11]|uniref:dihydropteroate synthase n=1 Tax=Nonlabens sp. YIK11 TaxID=1453349 RepID=UPI0006DC7F0E|nr:dihydropteroate synthase [Nonlabens sp. YIK11]KQC34355.1 dihydropteroate synthase [Nonlabens sp. YIK11]
MSTINCAGKLIDLSTPHVMGIVNITPDSFYDGGALKSDKDILKQVETMLADGATFIDIGGYSSKPDSEDISAEEEIQRVISVIDLVKKHFPSAVISCDSFRESVIAKALQHGIHIVNDISAGHLDAKMMETVGNAGVPYIMMHMRGTSQTMKSLTDYDDLVLEINQYFAERVHVARASGIKDIIIDPGFGFAKTTQQNFQLLKNLDLLYFHGLPILAGVSRKSMIYKTLGITASEALNGTSALHMKCLDQGAKILRVHDVKEAMEVIQLHQSIQNN